MRALYQIWKLQCTIIQEAFNFLPGCLWNRMWPVWLGEWLWSTQRVKTINRQVDMGRLLCDMVSNRISEVDQLISSWWKWWVNFKTPRCVFFFNPFLLKLSQHHHHNLQNVNTSLILTVMLTLKGRRSISWSNLGQTKRGKRMFQRCWDSVYELGNLRKVDCRHSGGKLQASIFSPEDSKEGNNQWR